MLRNSIHIKIRKIFLSAKEVRQWHGMNIELRKFKKNLALMTCMDCGENVEICDTTGEVLFSLTQYFRDIIAYEPKLDNYPELEFMRAICPKPRLYLPVSRPIKDLIFERDEK